MAHEHARKDETNTDKPRARVYVPRRRTARAARKNVSTRCWGKEGWMFRDGSRVTARAKEENEKRDKARGEREKERG